jgi:hypothetical protein
VTPEEVQAAAGYLDTHQMALVGVGATEEELVTLLEAQA